MVTAAPPIPDSTAEKPPRSRRWVPLSLRMFVVILFLLGVVGAFWVGVPAYRQSVAIREIERVRGWFTSHERGPDWLRRIVGTEQMRQFDNIVFVNLSHTTDTDRVAVHLKDLPCVEFIDFEKSSISDTGIVHVSGLAKLDALWLIDTQISDTGLQALTPILPQLKVLYLQGSNVTDDGMRYLKNLKNIECLTLSRTRVTDTGLTHIEGLTNLQSLVLIRTEITDLGLERLKGMSQLQDLCLYETRVTDEGVDDLQRALPTLQVER